MTDEDLWTTDTGIITDYEGTVMDAFFLLNSESQFSDKQTQLHLKMLLDDEREVEERYNLGPDWVSNDGGETATHPTKARFNKNTQAGKLVDALIEAGGGETVRSRGTGPAVAKTWIGLRFFMEATTTSGTRRDTGEKWSSTKNYPTKFLGVNGDVSTGATVTSLRESAVSAPNSGNPLSGMDPVAVAQITDLAKALTFGEWVDKVMEVEGVLGNDDLIMALPDEAGLYTSLRNEP